MSELDVLHSYGEELQKLLFLSSLPLAVKMLEKEEDIPDGAQGPLRDFGHHLSQCQAFAMSRRSKMSIAMLKEDNWCPEPLIGYGLVEPSDFFLEGQSRYQAGNVETLAAAKNWAQAFPCLKYGKYIGIVSAPLVSTNFEPDLVIIYCNPAQLTILLSSVLWKTGQDIKYRMAPTAACVYGVVLPIETGEYQVSVPCGGDRRRAIAQDDELIFTVPKGKLDDLLAGLRYIDKYYYGLPTQFTMMPEYPLPEAYTKLAKSLGMQI